MTPIRRPLKILQLIPFFLLGLALPELPSKHALRAEVFLLPAAGNDLIGRVEKRITRYEDTLPDLGRSYGLGYEEIVAANPGIDPWLPGEGREVQLPTRHVLPGGVREGLVVNLPEHRLYYFPKSDGKRPRQVISHPISTGKMDWSTPIGITQIISKTRNPSWYPPESVRKEHEDAGDPLPRVVPPGPDNPLGAFAMRLAIPGGAYLIHGTNKPIAVGMPVTHGCIRMYPEDIEALFPLVPVGTPVRIINEPVQTGWHDGVLYLEVHPPLEGTNVNVDLTKLTRILVNATRDRQVRINWPLAEKTLKEARGMPVAVSLAVVQR